MKRTALVVGVDHYEDRQIAPLTAAQHDATEMYGFLKHRAGFERVESLLGTNVAAKTVLDLAGKMVSELQRGDAFLFYFAGHGVTVGGRHTLLCPGVRYSRMSYFHETVPVDLLKDETSRAGVGRVFVLDACRTGVERGRGEGEGFRASAVLRDLVRAEEEVSGGGLMVMCSCGEGQQAREVAEVRRGLFTAALVEELEEAVRDLREVRAGEELARRVGVRMRSINEKYGLGGVQVPWVAGEAVEPVVLVPGRSEGGQRVHVVGEDEPSPKARTGRVEILREPILRIVTEPSGAGLTVDGIPRGQAPLALELSGGGHEVRAEKEGFEVWERRIRFDATGDAELLIELKEKRRVVEAWFPMTAQEAAEVQRASAAALGKGVVEQISVGPGVVLEMVWIPAGEFTMGSPEDEPGRDADEVQHGVKLTKGFWLGKYAVTQGQYRGLMRKNPSHFKGEGRPVEQVSWHDAVRFCSKLSEKLGLRVAYQVSGRAVEWDRDADGFRLPTEGEWEYACRAGTSSPFHTGKCLSTDEANYDGNHPMKGCRKGAYREETWDVGMGVANAWGLYNMHGNVWEWCWDWHGGYPTGGVTDPVGPSSGSDRVFRGGSWINDARSCRSACRDGYDPGFRRLDLGFRLARS